MRWTILAAFLIGLNALPAYADHDNGGGGSTNQCVPARQNNDETSPASGQKTNPCNGDQIVFTGETRTQTRDEVKRDCSQESRTFTRTNADGTGALATYRLREEMLDIFRFGSRRPSTFINRQDERIIAQKETLLGKQDDAANSFFRTMKSETTVSQEGRIQRSRTEERTRCTNSGGGGHGGDD